MSRDAGVVRDRAGLNRLLEGIDRLAGRHGESLPLVAAQLIARSALEREESRGAHWRSDFPETAAKARRTFITFADAQPVLWEPAE